MKNHFSMDCQTVLDVVYYSDKHNTLPILAQVRIWFHLLFCPVCPIELENLRNIEDIMKTEFLPPSPDFEEIIMKHLYDVSNIVEKTDAPSGFSLRSWIIIGFFVLLSLSSSFFSINFIEIADAEGLSFLLPVGLTIGMVVTCYGALFIGSNLNKLSTRFKLR